MKWIIFLTSFFLMLIQIVSGRALAPHVGTSVYAWTGVIGTTLLGITFGYWAGGQLADKNGSRKILGLAIILSGVAALASNYVVVLLGSHFGVGSMPLLARVIIMSFCAFFPVAFFLSTVMPQAMRLELHALGRVGTTYGSLSAWSAFGNILGTLAGAYFFISLLGTKRLMTVVAVALVLLGLYVARDSKLWRNKLALVVALFFIGDVISPGICQMETNYFCIRVRTEVAADGAKSHTLRLDHLVHSYVHEGDPLALGYDYEQVYANLIATRYTTSSAFTSFFIGGGGYVLPRYLEAVYPSSTVIVAEIDPGVTDANHLLMGLSKDTNVITHNQDARQVLQQHQDQPYDLVFGDAFNDFSVPAHLTTLEFHQLLKSRMSPNGVYALNIIDDARYGSFLAAMYRTLSKVWKYVEIAPQATAIKPGRNTIVLLASDTPINNEGWYLAASPAAVVNPDVERSDFHLISETDIKSFLDTHKAPVLTDDYVPIDRYLAPVFSDAY